MARKAAPATPARKQGSFIGWLLGLPFRYVFGLPLVGERKTDATFGRRGQGWLSETDRRSVTAYFNGGMPTRWDLMAGYERSFWRLSIPGVGLGVWWAWNESPQWTAAGVVVVMGVSLGLFSASRIVRWQRRHHMAHYVRPLARALGPELGQDVERPTVWLHVPRNFKETHAVITVDLPDDFHAGAITGGEESEDDDQDAGRRGAAGTARAMVDGFVYERLGLNAAEMTSRYEMVGPFPSVTYRHRPPVPGKVKLDDIREALEAARGAEFVLGKGRAGKVVTVSLEDDSPHVMQSVGSNGGKSVQAALFAVQVLARGGRVLILDPKGTSHRWAVGHPNVIYCRTMKQVHDALMQLGAEMARRQEATAEDEHGIDGCPRILVLVEERNALMERLGPWWEEYRAEEKTLTGNELPKKCPSAAVLREVAYMGREHLIHLFSIAQRADAQVMGGGSSRENYAARLMGCNTTVQTWNFLAPTATPRLTTKQGRFFLAMGSSVTEFQGAYLSRKELHRLAYSCFENEAEEAAAKARPAALFYREPGVIAGEVIEEPAAAAAPVSQVSDDVQKPVDLRKHAETVPESQAVSLQNASTPNPENGSEPKREGLTLIESPVSLSEAVDGRIVTCSLAVLRKAKTRDAEFPKPVAQRGAAHLFAPVDLRRWERNRPKAAKEESA